MGASSCGFCKLDDEKLASSVFLKKMEEGISYLNGVCSVRSAPFASDLNHHFIHFSYFGKPQILALFFGLKSSSAENVIPGTKVIFTMNRLADVDFLMENICSLATIFGEVYLDKNDHDQIPYEKFNHISLDLKGKKLVI